MLTNLTRLYLFTALIIVVVLSLKERKKDSVSFIDEITRKGEMWWSQSRRTGK